MGDAAIGLDRSASWQRQQPFEKLAEMLLDHLEGILNYCRTRVAMGVDEKVQETGRVVLLLPGKVHGVPGSFACT